MPTPHTNYSIPHQIKNTKQAFQMKKSDMASLWSESRSYSISQYYQSCCARWHNPYTQGWTHPSTMDRCVHL